MTDDAEQETEQLDTVQVMEYMNETYPLWKNGKAILVRIGDKRNFYRIRNVKVLGGYVEIVCFED